METDRKPADIPTLLKLEHSMMESMDELFWHYYGMIGQKVAPLNIGDQPVAAAILAVGHELSYRLIRLVQAIETKDRA